MRKIHVCDWPITLRHLSKHLCDFHLRSLCASSTKIIETVKRSWTEQLSVAEVFFLLNPRRTEEGLEVGPGLDLRPGKPGLRGSGEQRPAVCGARQAGTAGQTGIEVGNFFSLNKYLNIRQIAKQRSSIINWPQGKI
jgi:hypothetical protein